jgi:hypothetical protein
MNQPLIMKGGSKAHIIDLLNKYSSPINLYVLSALAMAIVFVKEIPVKIRGYAGSVFGRAVLFFVSLILADQYSWISGLFMAILSLLLLSLGPRTVAEGFQSPYNKNSKMVNDNTKWWVETVFKENPVAIEEDTVDTKAIQDGSNGSSSTSGQGGSH